MSIAAANDADNCDNDDVSFDAMVSNIILSISVFTTDDDNDHYANFIYEAQLRKGQPGHHLHTIPRDSLANFSG